MYSSSLIRSTMASPLVKRRTLYFCVCLLSWYPARYVSMRSSSFSSSSHRAIWYILLTSSEGFEIIIKIFHKKSNLKIP